MRIRDWSSDVCSSDLRAPAVGCYARNLLHADPAGRFSVWAMVWRPGQGSSVHDHCCWCVMGVHRGTLTEERFVASAGQEPPRLRGARRCGIGAVCALEPGVDDIHRVVNRDAETAISVHVYGFDPAVLARSVGRSWAYRSEEHTSELQSLKRLSY